jgi:AraC-like DNA-binding protein
MDLLWSDGGVVIAGPDTSAHLFPRQAGVVMTGLRFAPGFGPRVIGAPAWAFTNERVPLSAVWRAPAVRKLEGDLARHDDPGRAFEELAAESGGSPSEHTALVDAIVERVRRAMPVGHIADDIGLSSRQLQRRCLDAFGYGPKTLARVLRMVRALELARAGVPFADTAARSGYADQAHLSRDVKEFTGVPLRQLVGAGSGANRSTEFPSGSRSTA